jgi:hypothetical protein
MSRFAACILLALAVCAPSHGQEKRKAHPVYVNFFIHCESSPIRGVPIDVQYEPYSGEGILPRNQYLGKILDLCERYHFKFEFATTALFAHQLREDRPDIIERLKRMRIPISRYPSIAGHVLPPPIGEMRQMPGMLLHQLRSRETPLDRYLENEWIAETRTLTPGWHFEGERIVVENPRVGTPLKLNELAQYRIPAEERRLYSGTLALEEVFDVIPFPAFPPLFRGDSFRYELSPAQKALGMGSFPISRQPFEAFNAPFQAGDRRMLNWFKEHFPVDRPLHTDVGFAYTHNYDGRYIGLNLHEDLIRYIVEHPDEYKIVWPDPESVQYRAENRPAEFFKRTYGTGTLREIREMPAPLAKIRAMSSSIPIREVTRQEAGRTGWQKEMLYTLSELGVSSAGSSLPAFLRPRTESVKKPDVFAAARYLLEAVRFENGLGELPRQVKAGAESWTLAKTFLAMASYLEQFALYYRLPPSLELTTDLLGAVDYPPGKVASAADLDRQVDRLRGVADDPYINEVNLLQAVWEAAEKTRKELKIPARVVLQISQGRAGDYTGRRSQANAAEFLYAMAAELALMEKMGLPDKVAFRRMKIAPDAAAARATALDAWWTGSEVKTAKTASRAECLEAADYLLAAWTSGHLGHTEDIGGPPYGVKFAGGKMWSLNDSFQALAYSLMEQRKTGKMPESVSLKDVLGPLDYPMYELRSEPAYNVLRLRGGWQAYQMDVRDFPAPDLINVQGLPGPGHGGYQGFLKADALMASVAAAVKQMDTTGIIPGSTPVELPEGRTYPRATAQSAYINAGELMWGMAQLYRFLEVLGKPDDVYLSSCRLINDQLHFYIVGLNPVGFTRSTYRYQRESFDWTERVPAWRIERTWSYRGK